ncbi:trypco2 family protein [Actinophytocola glycyrrhizae]|uniref:Trypco2 family protein n=1 Tax=Actinophytocola glycyrrhizae TaxID=2044873 RepID=A0ABV9SC25_9PSEU
MSEVRLTLNVVAATTGGAKFEFTIPFIGMKFGLGGSVTTTDTHTIDITLMPSDLKPGFEVRGADVDDVLVDAIETVMAVMAHAGGGDDPFVLKESTVELTFAVTAAGTISLGVSGENKNEVTHTLKLVLGPVSKSVRAIR